MLRNTHSGLAYTLVAVIAAHASAVLLHSITPRDGMIGRMTFHLVKVRPRREYPEPIAGTASPASSPSECTSTIQPRASVQGIATRLQSIRIVGT
ncbi:MAG: cytochrome b [Mycobacterium sp.]|nr:cytochrome b [Mycobacterium sp.]